MCGGMWCVCVATADCPHVYSYLKGILGGGVAPSVVTVSISEELVTIKKSNYIGHKAITLAMRINQRHGKTWTSLRVR